MEANKKSTVELKYRQKDSKYIWVLILIVSFLLRVLEHLLNKIFPPSNSFISIFRCLSQEEKMMVAFIDLSFPSKT